MQVCWFAQAAPAAAVLAPAERAWLQAHLAATPKLRRGLLFTPSATSDPYLDDGPPPPLALQLYFDDIGEMEAALAPDGHLQALAVPGRLASLAGVTITQQAMLVRPFAVAEPARRDADSACTYLVAYHGEADDPIAWLTHYLAHHAPIMVRFPGIREVEVYTRLDWCGGLGWPRADSLQRNKVVFDDAAALTAALQSPIRHDMRADFQKFPPFRGRVTHFPMATDRIA